MPRLSPRAVRLCACAVLSGTGLFAFAPAFAEPSPALDRFSLSVGAFSAEPTVSASVNTPYGRLDSGDVQRGNVTLPRVQADVLLGDSQGLSFDYYRYSRDFSQSVAGGGTIGGTALAGGAGVDLGLRLDFAKLAYKWWIGSGDTVLGLGAGAAYYRATLDTNANVVVNGQSAFFSQRDSEDAIAPLLEVGVRHAFTPDLRVFVDASGVRKVGGDFRGNIYNAAAGVEWFPVKNIGLVLSYNVTNIDLRRDFDSGDSTARLHVRLKGPSAFLKARF